MLLRTALLWVHALCGVVWTGSCAAFVLAGSALAAGSDEWREFALKVAPRLDRINLTAAAILLLTGLANLAIAGALRNYQFSRTFMVVLGAKTALFIAMAFALSASWRAESAMLDDIGHGMRRMTRLSGLTTIAGTLALGLGLWLIGS